MATQKTNRPSNPDRDALTDETAPDPARAYGREKPEHESGMGRLDNNDDAVPENRSDTPEKAVKNRHGSHQLNAEEMEDERDAGGVQGHRSDDEEAGSPNMAKTPHYVDPRLRKKHH